MKAGTVVERSRGERTWADHVTSECLVREGPKDKNSKVYYKWNAPESPPLLRFVEKVDQILLVIYGNMLHGVSRRAVGKGGVLGPGKYTEDRQIDNPWDDPTLLW